jgi:hypothetical protein
MSGMARMRDARVLGFDRFDLALGGVRKGFWALLAAAVLLAVLVPTSILWRASSSELHLRACLWPAVASVGQTVHIFVVPLTEADRQAVAGPWAEFQITRDMIGMPMDTPALARAGRATTSQAFALPFALEMPGHWTVFVSVRTPARPFWQMRVPVTVMPPPSAGTAADLQAAGPTPRGCGILNGSQPI